MKLNNKQERLKTISLLPKPKLSMKGIRNEFKVLINFIESRTLKMDQRHIYKYDVVLDNLWHEEINYAIVQRLEFYYKDGKCIIEQLPVAGGIYKNTLEEEDYGFFYKGYIGQMGGPIITRPHDDGKEPQGYYAEKAERRLDIYTIDDEMSDKFNLLFQIPYFRKFYKLLKKQDNLGFGQFKEYAYGGDKKPMIETALKEGGFNLFNNCHGGGSTINRILLLENETKQFARKVIDTYGKNKSFDAVTFRDTLRIGREHIPNGSDDMLFKSGSKVMELHEEASIIDGKITKEMKDAAQLKVERLKKYLKNKKFNSKLVEITKPSTKQDVKKAGQEMNNCIGTYNPKNIYLVYIIINKEKYMVGVEWKPEDKKYKQMHTYNNGDLPDNGRTNILKNIKEVRNGSKEN